MRYLAFWIFIAALLAGRIVYYDEIRGPQVAETRFLAYAHSATAATGAAASTAVAIGDNAAPIRMMAGR